MHLELLYERTQIINGGKLCNLVGYGDSGNADGCGRAMGPAGLGKLISPWRAKTGKRHELEYRSGLKPDRDYY